MNSGIAISIGSSLVDVNWNRIRILYIYHQFQEIDCFSTPTEYYIGFRRLIFVLRLVGIILWI